MDQTRETSLAPTGHAPSMDGAPSRVEESQLAAALAARRKELDRIELRALRTLDAVQAERRRIDRYFDILG